MQVAGYWTIAEIARKKEVPEHVVRAAQKDGKLTDGRKAGGAWLFPDEAVRKYLKSGGMAHAS